MGIKCLLKFINETPGLIKDTNMGTYKFKKIAIDISLLIYKIVISVRNSGADYTNQKGEMTSHILGLFNKTIELLNNKIIPVYVFDGKPPSLKNKTLENRRLLKKKALEKLLLATTEEDKIKYLKRCSSITKDHWDQCRDLLTMMGVPYVNAPEEADSQCAYLAKAGLVDGVLTEDMDILTFGAPKIIRNLTSFKTQTTEISLENILSYLELNQSEFIECCILLGCDYCNGITYIKPSVIFDYYKKTRTIKDTLVLMRKDNLQVPDDIQYTETKEYFLNPLVEQTPKNHLMLKQPEYNKLLQKLVQDYGLIKFLIKKKLIKLVLNYEELKDL